MALHLAAGGASARSRAIGAEGAEGADGATDPPRRRRGRVVVLAWAFGLSNSARLVAYLPTLWAIQASGESDQHSLWTWGTFCAANTTMALWLLAQNDGRPNRAILVSAVNAALCAAIATLIAAHRFG